jgi:hypothetical protein
MKYKIIPKLNVSTLSSKSCPYKIYGATKPGVPANFHQRKYFTMIFYREQNQNQ